MGERVVFMIEALVLLQCPRSGGESSAELIFETLFL